jgi:hypothetical protein
MPSSVTILSIVEDGSTLEMCKVGNSMNRRIVGIIAIIVIIVVIVSSFLLWPKSRIHILDTRFSESTSSINAAGFNQIRTVYVTDSSHLFVYDIYNENITNILDVPSAVIHAVRDMVVAGTRGAFIASYLPYGGLLEYQNGLLQNVTLDVPYDTYFDSLAASPDGNILYMGGWNTGVIVYDLIERTLRNITENDGLLSNQIHRIYATSHYLLLSSSGGFQVYNFETRFFVNQTTAPDSSEILRANCISYLEASEEIYIGTEHGLHIYRLVEDEIVYLKTVGPSDGLPSALIEDLSLDITSHKLIISTRLGLAIYDVFSSSVERLEDSTIYRCTAVFHKYNGPICEIYFGTWSGGFLRLDFDYTPTNPIDYGPVLQTVTGFIMGLFVTIFGTVFQEWREDRKKKRQADEAIMNSLSIRS